MKNNKIEKVWTPKEIAEELKKRGIKLKCYSSAISHKKEKLKIKPVEKDISIKDIQDQLQTIIDEQNLINANLFDRDKEISEKFNEQTEINEINKTSFHIVQNQMTDILNEIEAIKKELKNKKNKLFRG